jgi:MoaF N-terminal domain
MSDPIRGKTLRWTYDDGPMAGKTFEHRFGADGTVNFREPGQPEGDPAKYEVERISDDVHAVSYLSSHGWTLTTVLDRKTGKIVSFASNEKMLMVQHGKLAKS